MSFMATVSPQQQDKLKAAYGRFREKISAAKKKTKELVISIEERKRQSRLAQIRQDLKRAS